MRAGRKRMIAGWAGAGVFTLVAVAWGVSIRWEVLIVGPRIDPRLSNGTVRLGVWSLAREVPWDWSAHRPMAMYDAWWIDLQLLQGQFARGYALPLWIPLGIGSLFAAVCWTGRRRGGCVDCGYDLKGLPPGSVCPECGR